MSNSSRGGRRSPQEPWGRSGCRHGNGAGTPGSAAAATCAARDNPGPACRERQAPAPRPAGLPSGSLSKPSGPRGPRLHLGAQRAATLRLPSMRTRRPPPRPDYSSQSARAAARAPPRAPAPRLSFRARLFPSSPQFPPSRLSGHSGPSPALRASLPASRHPSTRASFRGKCASAPPSSKLPEFSTGFWELGALHQSRPSLGCPQSPSPWRLPAETGSPLPPRWDRKRACHFRLGPPRAGAERVWSAGLPHACAAR